MTISSVFSFLLAVFKAIPALKQFWDGLITLYIEHEIARMRAENRAAIRKAFNEFDQQPIEEVIRSPRAGLPSGHPDSELRDSLPPGGL